jgi:hypothetical protein
MENNEEVKKQMFAHIDHWKSGNQSQKSYCIDHNIRYHVFHYYFKRYREVQADRKDARSFVRLQLDPLDPSTQVAHAELILPDGKRLVFHKPVGSDFLKALIS